MVISELDREEKLKKIINYIKNNDISMYSISKATGLSDGGINRIVNKSVKKPNINTLNLLYSHLFEEKGSEVKDTQESELKLEKDGVTFTKEEVILHIIANEEEYMEVKMFENVIERNALKKLFTILKDGKLKEFLE